MHNRSPKKYIKAPVIAGGEDWFFQREWANVEITFLLQSLRLILLIFSRKGWSQFGGGGVSPSLLLTEHSFPRGKPIWLVEEVQSRG